MLLASPAIGLWPLIFFAFTPFFVALERSFQVRPSFKSAFAAGYIFGLFYGLSLFFWLIHVNPWGLLPVIMLFAFMQAALGIVVVLALRSGYEGWSFSLLICCAWVAIEVVGSELILPLPAYGLGYYLWQQPVLIQLADVTGAFGISFWIIAINVTLARVFQDGFQKSMPWLKFVAMWTAITIAYGLTSYQPHETDTNKAKLQIRTIHTLTSTEDKNDRQQKQQLFDQYSELSRSFDTESSSRLDLVVWPETSVPVFLRSVKEREIVKGLLATAKALDAPLLMGSRSLPKWNNEAPQYFNSAYLVPQRGYISQEYHKNILAPGVETTPFAEILPSSLQLRWPSTIAKGDKRGLMDLSTTQKLGVFICWETFFPDFIRRVVDDGAGFLVNISNDEAAFGGYLPAYRIPIPHLVFRAVENRRYVVRSSNWGASMIISPAGDIIQSSKVGTEGAIDGFIVPNYEKTFFTRYGFLLAQILLAITVIWLCVIAFRLYRST